MELLDQLQSALGDTYTLERELGGGGMSRVFLARERTLDRRVVIKILPADFAASVSVERFRREIRLAASLQQANIVPVHSAGEVDGLPYYTMPFVEGESLRALLVARGALPVRDAVSILRDIARALSFAHEHGVFHRDIKPENVLLSGSTAVVTDFGIAKAIESSQTGPGTTALTHLGIALGTPAYISPEQASGDPAVDHRADIYALGVVAYELLTGAPPFVGRTAQALLAAHVVEQPAPVADRCRAAPPELATLIMRCLEKDPARRPQSAREMVDLLDAATTAADGPTTVMTAVKPSIAVMPFANLSPDPADGYFADGLTDEIITDLSPIGALHVIARASMMRFKDSGKDPLTVARELNVRYVLDGSVRRAGQSLRLTARLIDSADGSTLWTEKLGGTLDDVFEMQERVSRTIVDALALKLSPREEQQLRDRPIVDLRAYESYLQARQSMWIFTVPSLDHAHQLLTNAQGLVGTNARLIAALGVVHLNYLETGQVDPVHHLAAADACVRELAAIDADSFNLTYLRGWIQLKRGETREAVASLSHARELEPNSSDVMATLCYALILSGQDERAREVADAGIELDPLTPLFQCMPGFCEVVAGRPRAAIPPYRRFFEMDSSNPVAHFFLGWVLSEANERTDAITIFDGIVRLFPGTVFGQLGRAYGHALREEHAAGLEIMSGDMRSLTRHSETFARILGGLLTMLGDFEGAIDALEDSVRLGNSHYPYLADRVTVYAALRDHPRFRRLLEVVRQRWERGGASAADQVG